MQKQVLIIFFLLFSFLLYTKTQYDDNFLYAAEEGNLDEVKLFLEKGVDINIKDFTGRTALIFACRENHLVIVEFLIEKGADVNTKDNDGNTALMWASLNGNLDIIKKLIENGADINAINFDGKNVLAFAGDNNVVDFLRVHGAKRILMPKKKYLDNEIEVNKTHTNILIGVLYLIGSIIPGTNLFVPYINESIFFGFTIFVPIASISVELIGLSGLCPLIIGIKTNGQGYIISGICILSIFEGIGYLINLLFAIISCPDYFTQVQNNTKNKFCLNINLKRNYDLELSCSMHIQL